MKKAGAAERRLRPTWCEIPVVAIPEKEADAECCCAPLGSIKHTIQLQPVLYPAIHYFVRTSQNSPSSSTWLGE
jgi:hypothetical protein